VAQLATLYSWTGNKWSTVAEIPTLLNPPEGHAKLSKDEVQYAAEELLIAGNESAASTLTYACMNLASDPQLWERLY
jgi:cytochrome P450